MSRQEGECSDMDVPSRRRGWRLAFEEKKLEKHYQDDHRRRAVKAFRNSSIFIFILYTLLSSGIYLFMPESDVMRWLTLYGGVGVIIALAGVFSRLSFLDDWFHFYAGIGSSAAVALSVAVTGVVIDPVAGQLTQVAIMYAIVIIYSVVGLTFIQAVWAGWTGGVVGTVLAWMMDGSVNWDLLHRTYTGSSMLGMFIAYFAERHDRDLFIQTMLLRDAHEKAETYARKLDLLSRQDALTGLANRRHFSEILEQEWRRASRAGTPLAVLMIDVDHFKHYNDKMGHVKGDGCLRKTAEIIAHHARRPGDLAVRYGGEEFLLLYPVTSKEDACLQAERLVEAFHEAKIPQAAGLPREFVSVSVGVAVTVPGKTMLEAEELICAADDALYEAKNLGRDRWRFAAGIDGKMDSPVILSRHEHRAKA